MSVILCYSLQRLRGRLPRRCCCLPQYNSRDYPCLLPLSFCFPHDRLAQGGGMDMFGGGDEGKRRNCSMYVKTSGIRVVDGVVRAL